MDGVRIILATPSGSPTARNAARSSVAHPWPLRGFGRTFVSEDIEQEISSRSSLRPGPPTAEVCSLALSVDDGTVDRKETRNSAVRECNESSPEQMQAFGNGHSALRTNDVRHFSNRRDLSSVEEETPKL
jgi:hypothetical protein